MAKTKQALEGFVNVNVEDGKIKLTARWHDRDGEQHDCGFVIAPSWNAARRHASVLAEAVVDSAQRNAAASRPKGGAS